LLLERALKLDPSAADREDARRARALLETTPAPRK